MAHKPVAFETDTLAGVDMSAAPNLPPSDPAAYEEWFLKQVEEGIREADDPDTVWVSNEQVFKEIDARLDASRQRAPQRKAS